MIIYRACAFITPRQRLASESGSEDASRSDR
jgi:hypothetical protein